MSGMVGSGRGCKVVLGSPGNDIRSKGLIVPLQHERKLLLGTSDSISGITTILSGKTADADEDRDPVAPFNNLLQQ